MRIGAARAAVSFGGALALLSCRPAASSPAAATPFPAPATMTGARSAPSPPVPESPARPPEPGAHTSCAPLDTRTPSPASALELGDPQPIVDATGRVMAPFYERLARLLRGHARDHVRIAVYGDSNLTMDFITGEMRRVLQARWGDAGHGFIALGQPWSHYRHMDVSQRVHFGFTSYAVSTKPVGDGGYGLSGIAAESALRGAITEVGTAGDASPIGRRVSRLDLFFLDRPRCGSFDLRIDGVVAGTVDCVAPEVSLGFHRVSVPDGPHRFEVVVNGSGPVRMLGAALERKQPGFIVDSFGVGSMNTRAQTRELASINEPMLQRRRYDLVIFMTGANDVFERPKVPAWLLQIIEIHRRALPGVPILITTPPDRGKLKSFEPTVAIAAQRRELAAAYETAFWDLWSAMGGRGSMARFKRQGLAVSDYIHFNAKGGAWVGDRLLDAIFDDFARWLPDHSEAGCGDEPPPGEGQPLEGEPTLVRAAAMGQNR